MKQFKKRLRLSAPALIMALVIALSPISVFAEGTDGVPVIYDVDYQVENDVLFALSYDDLFMPEFLEAIDFYIITKAGDGYELYDATAYLTDEIDYDGGSPSAFAPFRSPALGAEITLDAIGIAPMQEVSADHLLNTGVAQLNADIVPFNTNPNLAINITNFIGMDLSDLANHQERWYHFNVAANRKITVQLSYQSGIYDLALFRLVGSTLHLVQYSIEGRGLERINHISQSGGVYFLAVLPFVPAPVPHFFNFAVEVTSHFDSWELNGFHHQAVPFTNTINLQANLDNRFDQDWFRLNVTAARTKDITVSNAPAGNHYAVFLYDRNLNRVGSFFANVSATRRVDFSAGHYFIRIQSLTGHVVPNNYTLTVVPFVPPPPA